MDAAQCYCASQRRNIYTMLAWKLCWIWMEIKDRQQNLMTNPTENGNEIGSENFRANGTLNNGIKMEDPQINSTYSRIKIWKIKCENKRSLKIES